ncbi:glycoside hydrolase family 6 protein [Agromyces italicus]|uniref:glycoside hydrolase family 6 protein n=1 Tax=Agromyces italicus TaxID=279572 RepID=UPI0004180C05|nr:glycoside hydrolase family 6 protein [Agromyces italicus]
MSLPTPRRWPGAAAALCAVMLMPVGTAVAVASTPAPPPGHSIDRVLEPGVPLWANPGSTTIEAAATLDGQAAADALLLGSLPSANWINGGTPGDAKRDVKRVVAAAHAAGEVPVLVAYNLPFRDCAQYSAGGATSVAEYTAWIDGVAQGIGNKRAVVILEPDGLGIIPWYTSNQGATEWCQPAEADAGTAASDRFSMLNHAVDALAALPSAAVYLDGTHSGWLGVGDITDRLVKAGVERADGFFLNASNYIETGRLAKYGSWVADCLLLETEVEWWDASWCASQYYPADPADFSTWQLTDRKYDADLAGAGLTRDAASQAHFVIDTSRNGRGPWAAPAGWPGDAEAWCNPPDRGAGARPTTTTGSPLIDAFLWIKVPGDSDGKCFRGTGGPLDPIRDMEDPAAGQWFPEQARELIEFAVPSFG